MKLLSLWHEEKWDDTPLQRAKTGTNLCAFSYGQIGRQSLGQTSTGTSHNQPFMCLVNWIESTHRGGRVGACGMSTFGWIPAVDECLRCDCVSVLLRYHTSQIVFLGTNEHFLNGSSKMSALCEEGWWWCARWGAFVLLWCVWDVGVAL